VHKVVLESIKEAGKGGVDAEGLDKVGIVFRVSSANDNRGGDAQIKLGSGGIEVSPGGVFGLVGTSGGDSLGPVVEEGDFRDGVDGVVAVHHVRGGTEAEVG